MVESGDLGGAGNATSNAWNFLVAKSGVNDGFNSFDFSAIFSGTQTTELSFLCPYYFSPDFYGAFNLLYTSISSCLGGDFSFDFAFFAAI